jgi:hypothetical protein
MISTLISFCKHHLSSATSSLLSFRFSFPRLASSLTALHRAEAMWGASTRVHNGTSCDRQLVALMSTAPYRPVSQAPGRRRSSPTSICPGPLRLSRGKNLRWRCRETGCDKITFEILLTVYVCSFLPSGYTHTYHSFIPSLLRVLQVFVAIIDISASGRRCRVLITRLPLDLTL